MGTQKVPLMTPVKGVVRAVGRESQPPDTCWDARNVLPYDRYGRKRLAQRGGLLRQFPDTLNGHFVQGMIEAPNIIYPPNSFSIPVADLPAVLPGWPGPDIPIGTGGPIAYAGPSFSISLIWELTITLAAAGDVSIADLFNNWTYDRGAYATFHIPFNANPASSLIFTCSCGVNGGRTIPDGGFFQFNAGIQTWRGNPAVIGSWVPLGSASYSDLVTGFSKSGSAVATIRIEGSKVTLLLDPGDETPPFTMPFSRVNPVELNLLESGGVENNSDPSNVTVNSSSASITG